MKTAGLDFYPSETSVLKIQKHWRISLLLAWIKITVQWSEVGNKRETCLLGTSTDISTFYFLLNVIKISVLYIKLLHSITWSNRRRIQSHFGRIYRSRSEKLCFCRINETIFNDDWYVVLKTGNVPWNSGFDWLQKFNFQSLYSSAVWCCEETQHIFSGV